MISTAARVQRGQHRADAKAPVWITGVSTALPDHRIEGAELLATLGQIWPRLQRRIRQFDPEIAGGTRYCVRPAKDFATPLSLDEQRSWYVDQAAGLATRAATAALNRSGISAADVGLLVVSSCTGFVLPGVDVRLVQRLGLRDDVRRLPLAHFGCAGGAAGLAHAAEWVRGAQSRHALVVAVEVPSITFRPTDTSSDNLLSALVFGDGAAAALLGDTGGDDAPLRLERCHTRLLPASHDALGFEVLADGFRVVVSRRLPEIVERHLPALTGEVLATPPAALDAVAVHPGGRAIVEAVARCLGLDDRQIAATRRVLERTGNTSSAALLFVLAELAADLPTPSGRGVAIAFGPGLTVELLELCW